MPSSEPLALGAAPSRHPVLDDLEDELSPALEAMGLPEAVHALQLGGGNSAGDDLEVLRRLGSSGRCGHDPPGRCPEFPDQIGLGFAVGLSAEDLGVARSQLLQTQLRQPGRRIAMKPSAYLISMRQVWLKGGKMYCAHGSG